MEFKSIRFEEPEPGIGLITLNRPDRLNAIDLNMLDDMQHLFNQLCDDLEETIRVIVITGAGRGFCAGADLLDARALTEAPEKAKDAASFLIHIQKKYARMIQRLRSIPQPVIAAVNGPAAGGGFTMVLASDLVYAAPRASFIASFLNLGLSGGELGTTFFLPKKVGSSIAAEIIMTGRKITAEEAAQIRMINRVVEEEVLLDTAMETARLMLTKSLRGLRFTKEALNHGLTAPSLEAAIEFENRNQAICAFTPEFAEAVLAFSKK